MIVVYIAGPYRGRDAWHTEDNIRRAERLALDVWRLGAAAICPHANARYFSGAFAEAIVLAGDLEIMRRCDAVLLTPDWLASLGARAEHDDAVSRGLPVFDTVDQLRDWIDAGAMPVGRPSVGDPF